MPLFDGKIRSRLQSRSFLKRDGKRLGKGNVMSKVGSRADKITSRVKERRPNIIPNVEETLGKWNVGSRITEMLPASLKLKNKPIVKRRREEKLEKQSGADISL